MVVKGYLKKKEVNFFEKSRTQTAKFSMDKFERNLFFETSFCSRKACGFFAKI